MFEDQKIAHQTDWLTWTAIGLAIQRGKGLLKQASVYFGRQLVKWMRLVQRISDRLLNNERIVLVLLIIKLDKFYTAKIRKVADYSKRIL